MAHSLDIPARRSLTALAEGQSGRVSAIRQDDAALAMKLREMGFAEGDEIELVTRGPFGGQPLAVRLNRTLIAMRTVEAEAIEIDAEQ